MKWTKEEIELSINLIKDNKTFIEIANILNKSHTSVSKKLNRLGYKSSYNKTGVSKYELNNWEEIQKKHDEGYSYKELIKEFKLTFQAIDWAKKNKKLIFRTQSEGMKNAHKKGKYPKCENEFTIYKNLCEFKFNVYDYPEYFNLDLIKKYGWYRAKNNGNNLFGVSRDHMYSISEGFKKGIDPYYISHPVNCELILQSDNSKKRTKCSITLNILKQAAQDWDNKTGI
jgi:predicted transcriptional regulator